jgi:hypothetical protein
MNALTIVSSFHRNRALYLASRYRLTINRENIVISNNRALINFKKSI